MQNIRQLPLHVAPLWHLRTFCKDLHPIVTKRLSICNTNIVEVPLKTHHFISSPKNDRVECWIESTLGAQWGIAIKV